MQIEFTPYYLCPRSNKPPPTMETLPTPVPMGREQLNQIEALLGVSWASEFELNKIPGFNSQDQHNNALRWSFPQAFYASVASIRAVKACQGEYITTRPASILAGEDLAQSGHYGPLLLNLVEVLESHVGTFGQPPLYADDRAICKVHDLLRVVCAQALTAHELIVIEHIGIQQFGRIVEAQPSLIRAGNIAQRLVWYYETCNVQ